MFRIHVPRASLMSLASRRDPVAMSRNVRKSIWYLIIPSRDVLAADRPDIP